jgi:hypothetical protein
MGGVGEVGWGLLVCSLLVVPLSHSGRKLLVDLGCERHLHGWVEVQLAAVHVLFVGVWLPTVFLMLAGWNVQSEGARLACRCWRRWHGPWCIRCWQGMARRPPIDAAQLCKARLPCMTAYCCFVVIFGCQIVRWHYVYC